MRNELVRRAADEGWWCYFTHDPGDLPVQIEANEKGSFRVRRPELSRQVPAGIMVASRYAPRFTPERGSLLDSDCLAPAAAVAAGAPGRSLLAACSSGASTTPLPSGAEPPSDCARVEDGVITLSATGPGVQRAVHGRQRRRGVHHPLHQQRHACRTTSRSTTTARRANEIMTRRHHHDQGDSLDYEVEALERRPVLLRLPGAPAEMNGTLYVVEG